MANPKGATNVRNFVQNGKSYLLPPKCPFPSITPAYTEYGPNACFGSKSASKSRGGNAFHQRTSSESLLEEQPSWLDELLNEPETPVRKGHRRSSSDSFAYFDACNMSNIEHMPMSHDESKFRPMVASPLWRSKNMDLSMETSQGSHYFDNNICGKFKNKPLEKLTLVNLPSGLCSSRDNSVTKTSGASNGSLETNPITAADKQDQSESGSHDSKPSAEKKESSHAKCPAENDSKRAKQQFAQRSRVRKLQYIAELERNVQALQAEGSKVSAELEFFNQKNLILSMENKALKQRLESLAQEKLIKYVEHDVLEREIRRLRSLYLQLQQQPHQQTPHQQLSSSHRRTNSRDLDLQFANLNLKH